MRLALTIAALACASPAEAATWKQVYPLQDKHTFVITSEGVGVFVMPPPPYPGDAVSDEEFQASYEDSRIVIKFRDLPPYDVPTDTYRESPYGISVGIGRMAPDDAAPTVLIGGYSGGAHCCATLQAVSLVDGKPVSVLLPRKDGGPVDAFPEDIDGDGVREIRWQDDSLLYEFTSYAASWSVPRIYHLRRGELIDVSRTPSFATIYHDFAREMLGECQDKQGGENAGACAAYAYAMAIQAEAENGIRTAVTLATRPSWSASQCAAEFNEDLCAERRAYAGFEDALRLKMLEHGYLP